MQLKTTKRLKVGSQIDKQFDVVLWDSQNKIRESRKQERQNRKNARNHMKIKKKGKRRGRKSS